MMQMIILTQDTINSVAKFLKIIVKILASYLRDQAKFFFDIFGVNRPKRIWKNKKLAFII